MYLASSTTLWESTQSNRTLDDAELASEGNRAVNILPALLHLPDDRIKRRQRFAFVECRDFASPAPTADCVHRASGHKAKG